MISIFRPPRFYYCHGKFDLLTDEQKLIVENTPGLWDMVQGSGSFKRGMIMMWSGAIAAIPYGWALCNGSNGTPDLRSRFIVGAGSTYSPGNTGGSDSVSLSVAQMPSHNHTITSGQWDSYTPTTTAQVVTQGGMMPPGTATGSAYYPVTSYTGSGSSHENRPPYYALAYIMKL